MKVLLNETDKYSVIYGVDSANILASQPVLNKAGKT